MMMMMMVVMTKTVGIIVTMLALHLVTATRDASVFSKGDDLCSAFYDGCKRDTARICC